MAYLSAAKGLVTFINEISAPEGALSVANNIVIDEPNVIEPRRGYADYGNALPLPTDRLKQLMVYKNILLRHFGSTIQFDNGSGTFQSFSGSYSQIENNIRLKYLEANGNFYFTTSEGIKKISALSSSEFSTASGYIYPAGGLKGLDISVTATGSLSWLQPKHQVAYRIVWGTKDKNNNLILGSPSARYVLTNSSASDHCDATITIQVPEGANTNYFIQVYRTAQVDTSALTELADISGDEMNLVDERPYDGTSSPVIIVDETPEEFRDQGAYLYTNPISGQGTLQANERPPIAVDISYFRNSVLYANTKTSHRYITNLLAADGLAGYSLFIGNASDPQQYRFITGPSVLTSYGADVQITNSGSISIDIDGTALELVKMINRNPNSMVNAYYQTTDESLPGLFQLEGKIQSDVAFYVGVDNAAIKNLFNPEMPVVTLATITTSTEKSDNEEAPNRVYYSKLDQPEAVPVVNYVDIGPKDKKILRIIALRDSLFVLKEDGIYTITGSTATGAVSPTFSVRLLDNSVEILSADSCEILNNTIYALSSQGIVSITETGVEVISRAIENLIRDLTKFNINYKALCFGITSNIDRAYLLWCPQKAGDTSATQVLRYNTFTRTWTRWVISSTCGIIKSDDNKIYIGRSDTNMMRQERRNLDRTDFSDDQAEVAMLSTNAIQGLDVLVTNVVGISPGDVLYQKQYITASFFNRMLKKLDLDFGLTDNDYYTSLKISSGDNLRDKVQALVTKLANDATIGTFVPLTVSNDFATIQTELNSIITQLNSLITGTAFKNYRQSEGSAYWETIIESTNVFTNRITVNYAIPLLYGVSDNLIYFKGIPVEVRWQPQHFGAPEKLKQIADAAVIVDQNNFFSAEIGFNSDLSQDFQDILFFGKGVGTWGMQPFGEFIWGGMGNDAPFRTLIPLNKQKCRYLTCRFLHFNAREKFRLIGISCEPRSISNRAYR